MKDRLWHEAYLALSPVLARDDVVLAPRGGWPPFPCTLRCYDDWIELGGAGVLVLHKGRMSGMDKAALRAIAASWQCLFANGVMVVFSKAPRLARDARLGPQKKHCRKLEQYLDSARLRKRKSKIIYVHVPKAGGTSMWSALRAQFPSHVYYSDTKAALRNPPGMHDYDLIGIHFSPTVVASCLEPDDWIVGMVREPAARFLSTVLHSRRTVEDADSFTPAQKQMRQASAEEFLESEDGRYESRLQLILFGTDYRKAFHEYSEVQMLEAASAFAARERVILAPVEQSARFAEVLARELSMRQPPLRRLNATDRSEMGDSLAEFAGLDERLQTVIRSEREWYDFVCRRFEERFPAARPAPLRRLLRMLKAEPG